MPNRAMFNEAPGLLEQVPGQHPEPESEVEMPQAPTAARAAREGFRLIEFNPRRHARKAEAARVAVPDALGGGWLWMSARDIRRNIAEFGDDPELCRALAAYKTPHVRIDEEE